MKLVVKSDDLESKVVVWGFDAINYLKKINEGDRVSISNLSEKTNPYTSEKEFLFTKVSSLKVEKKIKNPKS